MLKQLFSFYILACLFSWLVWLPLYAPALGLSSYEPFLFQHGLGALGPAIASAVMTWRYQGVEGLRQLFERAFKPGKVLFLLVALFSPFFIEVIGSIVVWIQTGRIPDLQEFGKSKEFPSSSLLSLFIYNLFFFGYGEELGWRGFALPVLQSRWSALWSSIVLTFFWALWHWPLFLYRPGYLQMDAMGAIGWLMSLLTGSVLLTWLFNSSGGSLLVCAIFHSTIDLAFMSDKVDPEVIGLTGILIVIWGILTVVICKPRHLSHLPRIGTSPAQ